MPKSEPPKAVKADDVIAILLTRELHPDVYARWCKPWETLITRPSWRHAKALFADHPDRVRAVVDALVEAQNGHPNSALLMCQAKVRQACGDHEGAIELFERLVDRAELDYAFKATFNIGKCRAALGDDKSARAAFEDILRQRPRDVHAARELIPILRRSGESDRADELLSLLPAGDPLRDN